MSSAADDRLILGKRGKRRAQKERVKMRQELKKVHDEAVALIEEIRNTTEWAVQQAERDRFAAEAKLTELERAQPQLVLFRDQWLRAGLLKRIWLAFVGKAAFKVEEKA